MPINTLPIPVVLDKLLESLPDETAMILPTKNGIMIFDKQTTDKESDVIKSPSLIGVIYLDKKQIPATPRIGIIKDDTKHTDKDVEILTASITFGSMVTDKSNTFKVFKSELSRLSYVIGSKPTDEVKDVNHQIVTGMMSNILQRIESR